MRASSFLKAPALLQSAIHEDNRQEDEDTCKHLWEFNTFQSAPDPPTGVSISGSSTHFQSAPDPPTGVKSSACFKLAVGYYVKGQSIPLNRLQHCNYVFSRDINKDGFSFSSLSLYLTNLSLSLLISSLTSIFLRRPSGDAVFFLFLFFRDPQPPPEFLVHLGPNRFAGTINEEYIPPYRKVEDAADSGDVSIELGLGLSLGNCFEADPIMNTRLMRSSSTAVIALFPAEIDFSLSSAPLARAWSLPAEADEDRLKRKEMQGLKRMEFKRKRLEKRSGSRLPETVGFGNRKADQNSASRPPLPPRLRSLKSFQEEEEEEVLKSINLNGSKDVGSNIMAEMPFVSAEGCGPNGRRVDGFLYNYRRGEEVRIVCICHGSFHTPAEFAGGSVVPHTLRQIVVNPSPLVYY
ncbi:Ninja-family protein AFP3 [Platanthera guangdongensis]|uniref:Ninja-family protein n=1 Tax=Platanthera guangdongensis TaxID=2320717 RepID=A0ABR2MEC6_9ASPA